MCVPPYRPWCDCLYVFRARYGGAGAGPGWSFPISRLDSFLIVVKGLGAVRACDVLVEKRRACSRREGGADGMAAYGEV